jgi:hypothetical protein
LTKIRPGRTHYETNSTYPIKIAILFLLQTYFVSQSNTNCEISANLCSSIDIVKFFASNKIPTKIIFVFGGQAFSTFWASRPSLQLHQYPSDQTFL